MLTPARVLVNGEPAAGASALDRGLAYGDGVFRTLRIARGRACWWDDQLETLRADCVRLKLNAPESLTWRADLQRLTLPQEGVMRLTVTRGEGPRGYAPPAETQETRIMAVWPAATPGAPTALRARVCDLRLARQPALAGVKHLNRLEQVLARAEWRDDGIGEGLLLDDAQRLISGVSSNVFLLAGAHLLTPRLDHCGVAGVTRARLLRGAASLGLAPREAELTMDDLRAADAVFFTNSLMRLGWLRDLDARRWAEPAVLGALWNLLDHDDVDTP